jgi:maltose alpha-D-glucosyltransferase/alpha-amylase
MGLVYAAFADPEFARDLARAMGENQEMAVAGGRLRFTSTKQFADHADAIADEVRTPALEQSNTAVFFGSRLFLKGYRRLREGVNPELEMGRFLTDVSPFPQVAPILGAVEYVEEGAAEPATLAVLQRFVENQGDLWSLICEHLGRMLAAPAAPAGDGPAAESAVAGFHLGRMGLLGQRVAQLHRALCVASGDPAFDPEPITHADFEGWKKNIAAEMDATLDEVEKLLPTFTEQVAAKVRPLIEQREVLRGRILGARPALDGVMKTRFHGDLHLGQVLVAQDDFIIVDFEGEPGRSMEARRAKSSVLRDVAGMLRSFSYAGRAALLKREATRADGADAVLAWEAEARHYFLEGYAKGADGLASVPGDAESFRSTLDLFLIEKALYEMRYEIANRPDWIDIPLTGITELLK